MRVMAKTKPNRGAAGSAVSVGVSCHIPRRLVRRIEEGALGSQASTSLRVVLRENQVAWSAYDAPLG